MISLRFPNDSRAPRGARGLKLGWRRLFLPAIGRAPRGARGLKHQGIGRVLPGRVAPRAGRVD